MRGADQDSPINQELARCVVKAPARMRADVEVCNMTAIVAMNDDRFVFAVDDGVKRDDAIGWQVGQGN